MAELHKRSLTKPDGRAPHPLRPPAARRRASRRRARASTPPGTKTHLRWHPLRGEWVAYASHRQNRTFLPPPEYNPLAPTTDPENPTEVPAGHWDVAVFENRFPTLTLQAEEPAPPSIVDTRPGKGVCEVVVFTQDPKRLAGRAAARPPGADPGGLGRPLPRARRSATTCSTSSRSRTAASRWGSRCTIRTGRSTPTRSSRRSRRGSWRSRRRISRSTAAACWRT